MITAQDKQQIVALLNLECNKKGASQNKVANKLQVNSSTLTQMRNGNHSVISEAMWIKVGKLLGFRSQEWKPGETRDFRLIFGTLDLAQKSSISMAISDHAGRGKTFACKYYASTNTGVFYLQCEEMMTKRQFLIRLAGEMGLDVSEMKTIDISEYIIESALKLSNPLFIFDEFDKLNDRVKMIFIQLYNRLEARAGLVICGTDKLRIMIERGAKKNKLGYQEIFSRIGKTFVSLNGANAKDVKAICVANGINKDPEVNAVIKESEDFAGDLRRVERVILKSKLFNAA